MPLTCNENLSGCAFAWLALSLPAFRFDTDLPATQRFKAGSPKEIDWKVRACDVARVHDEPRHAKVMGASYVWKRVQRLCSVRSLGLKALQRLMEAIDLRLIRVPFGAFDIAS
ncbi:hypothetical protein D9M69_401250 [compost metagenome]